MRCSRCGACCENTEMLLCRADIRRLENKGYERKDFVYFDREGLARLKNKNGYCFFYDADKKKCKVYRSRPLGCRLYPVVYSDEEAKAVADDFCPMENTVSKVEIEKKGRKLVKLIRVIEREAKQRLNHSHFT